MKKTLLIALCLLTVACSKEPAYKNPSLSPEKRAEDLLKRMTLEEKIAQLECIWTAPKKELFTDGKFDPKKAAEKWPDGLGFMARPNENLFPETPQYHPALPAREAAILFNEYQKYFVENTRLGIPLEGHDEGVHGHISKDATCFPMPIGLSCSWDEALLEDVFSVTAKEIRAKGGSEGLGPVLDIVRDPRWGRTEEMMGEDPYLVSRLGIAAVKGGQGSEKMIPSDKVGITLKHMGVHGAPEGGNNTAPSYVDEHEARESFLFPFREVIRECQPMYIMFTYNEIWGQPAHASKHLLQDILRDEFKFEGCTVSDYEGISNMHYVDKVCPTLEDAAAMAINAGIDVEFPNPTTYIYLKDAVKKGLVSEKTIDRAVYDVLVGKFRLGLFEHPYVDVDAAEKTVGCEDHRKVAYKAACESMVLLKNDADFLPLDSNKVKTIALIGPNADRCILGGYSGVPKDTITPLRAMRERFGDRMNILYSEGVRITDYNSPFPPVIRAYSYEDNKAKIDQAVATAARADYVVLFVGDSEGTSREAYGPEAPGDLPTLELLAGQKELIEKVAALGKPTCAFVNCGTTLNVGPLEEKVPAVMMCWYLGQEGGYAMVDALFGKVNPSGKLSMSIPHGAGFVPAYYNHKGASRRGYNLGYDVRPLHPFGYGLSYTTFEYSDPKVDKTSISKDGSFTVAVNVKNTGKRDGVEIVQLYITDDYATLTRPVKELKDFARVPLKEGESKEVSFTVTPDKLAYYDLSAKWGVESGTFTIGVGPSSDSLKTVSVEVK